MNDVYVEDIQECPEHPGANIRHNWTRDQYCLNGKRIGVPVDTNHKYECVECGRELQPKKGATMKPVRLCPNCRQPGNHFVPPFRLGEKGFYICTPCPDKKEQR